MDALIRIPKEEGWMTLYSGGVAAVLKAAVGNCAQLAVYDQVNTYFGPRIVIRNYNWLPLFPLE